MTAEQVTQRMAWDLNLRGEDSSDPVTHCKDSFHFRLNRWSPDGCRELIICETEDDFHWVARILEFLCQTQSFPSLKCLRSGPLQHEYHLFAEMVPTAGVGHWGSRDTAPGSFNLSKWTTISRPFIIHSYLVSATPSPWISPTSSSWPRLSPQGATLNIKCFSQAGVRSSQRKSVSSSLVLWTRIMAK